MAKNIVITGGSSDIGRSIALQFKGEHLILLGRNMKKLEELVALNKGDGLVIQADLASNKSTQKAIETIKSTYSHIDMIIYIAGIYHDSRKAFYDIAFEEYTAHEIDQTMQVGLFAPMILSHELLPLMGEYAKIIMLSGTFESGAKGWLPYYVSKKGIEDLTVGLSQELSDKHIQVNCISPSDTLTHTYKEFFPTYATEDLCIKPTDIANLAAFLASSNGNAVTGQVIVVKKS